LPQKHCYLRLVATEGIGITDCTRFGSPSDSNQIKNALGKIAMLKLFSENNRDGLILVSRIILVLLFLIFGWMKLTGYSGTVSYMAQVGAPLPPVSAIIAIVMEFGVSIALILGLFVRPLAILLLVYTLGTSLIGHHYWTMTGAEQYENMINFYKNVSVMGGLLLLFTNGPGKYSLDAKFGLT
jgi:putative oxidoreductase